MSFVFTARSVSRGLSRIVSIILSIFSRNSLLTTSPMLNSFSSKQSSYSSPVLSCPTTTSLTVRRLFRHVSNACSTRTYTGMVHFRPNIPQNSSNRLFCDEYTGFTYQTFCSSHLSMSNARYRMFRTIITNDLSVKFEGVTDGIRLCIHRIAHRIGISLVHKHLALETLKKHLQGTI